MPHFKSYCFAACLVLSAAAVAQDAAPPVPELPAPETPASEAPASVSSSGPLAAYIAAPDDSFSFSLVERRDVGSMTIDLLQMTSQSWQGNPWRHHLMILRPYQVNHDREALLMLGGGNAHDPAPSLVAPEAEMMKEIAEKTRSLTALLLQTPNQPLFEGLREEALIAHTFEQYLAGEGDDWPLLLPMTKAAVRGMDVLTAFAKEQFAQELHGFVLTGTGSRGWAALLAAAHDSRVAAAAPAAVEEWPIPTGDGAGNAENGRLRAVVDPAAYGEWLQMPKLMVLGTTGVGRYFSTLPAPRHFFYQSNAGQELTDSGVAAITHFYNRHLTRQPFPTASGTLGADGAFTARWDQEGGSPSLWTAQSDSPDFTEAGWESRPLFGNGEVTVQLEAPEAGYEACYVQVLYRGEELGMPFGVCTPMQVLPDPEAPVRTTALPAP